MGCALAIDTGAAFLQAALIDESGQCLKESYCIRNVDHNGPAQEVIAAFRDIARTSAGYAKTAGIPVVGVGVAIPGPFDFRSGKSLMLHKFRNIFRYDLKTELMLDSKSKNVRFMHDVFAFLLGEKYTGKTGGYERSAAVTIGDGLGFGCMINGVMLTNALGSPHLGLYKEKALEGILEDYVSNSGIIKMYEKNIGSENGDIGAADIARKAIEGDGAAVKVFDEVGQLLCEFLVPIIDKLEIECLVLGSQSYDITNLLIGRLKECLNHTSSIREVTESPNMNLSTMIGATRSFFEE